MFIPPTEHPHADCSVWWHFIFSVGVMCLFLLVGFCRSLELENKQQVRFHAFFLYKRVVWNCCPQKNKIMKKNIFFAIALMALSLIGCEKEGGYIAEPESIPTLQTATFTGVTSSTAIVAGKVNVSVSESQDTLGIMYSDNKDSLLAYIGNSEVATFFNGKEFELELKGLQPKTIYYYRAWLTLDGKSTTYGEIKQFTTLEEGSVKAIGEFSIAKNQKIAFSQGNLQYRPTTKTWCFAKNQLEYLGEANTNIAPTYLGWLDMFGWGTGNDAAKSSTNNSDYAQFIPWGNELISGELNIWRALTADEWNYLLYSRTNADSLYAAAIVNRQNGVIIFPDAWYFGEKTHVILPYDSIVILVNDTTAETIVFTPKTVELPSDKILIKLPKDTIYPGDSIFYAGLLGWDVNRYSTSEWNELEARGAVFLPATGSRQGWVLNSVQNYGRYWSATEYNEDKAYSFCFYDYGLHMGTYDRSQGQSVRLVKDL